MSKLRDIREQIGGLTTEVFRDIITIYFEASMAKRAGADDIPRVLNSYEKEILRLNEALTAAENEINRQATVISRTRQKNSNYRTSIKQLQRSHEALLHRHEALQQTVATRQEVQADGPYSLVNFKYDEFGL